MNKPTIIIWEGQWWQDTINKALQDHGYKTILTSRKTHKFPASAWPRDSFVNYNGVYLDSRNGTKHNFWEWWNVLVGDGVALLSVESVLYDYRDLKELQNALCSILGNDGTMAHVIPNLYKYRNMDYDNIDNSHIDPFMLLCPRKKLFLLDTNHIKTYYEGRENDIEDGLPMLRNIITNYAKLTYIEYDWKDEWTFPLNWLVLPWQKSEDTDLVVIDSTSKKLSHILQGNGIEVIAVDMPQLPYDETAGKIRCQTNVVDDTVDKEQLEYLLHN